MRSVFSFFFFPDLEIGQYITCTSGGFYGWHGAPGSDLISCLDSTPIASPG